ncbi:MAG: hypothetical protein FJ405_10685 [Verrucomicrobia bacterium]|nr:hypothetical protein [Verrucomicrobiota bacterium]
MTPDSIRPWISLNMAMTADGKIATANRKVSSFGSKNDLKRLFELRAESDAVMSGASTVAETNADLGSGGRVYQRERLRKGLESENLRIVASGRASLDPRSRLFQCKGGQILVLTTAHAPRDRRSALIDAGAILHVSPGKEIDWKSALNWMHSHWKVRRLHCEGGAELNDSLFRKGWIDEIHLTLCPWIVGGRVAPTLSEGKGFPALKDAEAYRYHRIVQKGNEVFLTLRRCQPNQGTHEDTGRRSRYCTCRAR